MSEGVLVALISVIGGTIIGSAISAVVTSMLSKKKDEAETSKMITESVTSLIQPLNDRINDIEIEVKDWRNCAEARGRQLERANIVPAPFVSTKGK